MVLELRLATPADARAIAEVHVAAWRESYSHLFPAEFLASMNVDSRTERWREILVDGVTTAAVAIVDGSVVGWATAGAGRDDDAPVPLELEGLYLLAAHHGTGVAEPLVEFAIGTDAAYLWVAEQNPRAQAFYQRIGFALDGAQKLYASGDTTISEVRMTRR